MSESFKKLKNKYMRAAVIKSSAVGACCGLLAVGAVLLPVKLCAAELFWAYYLLIGLGVALVVGGGLFLFLRPTDKKLAKLLDGRYALHEKVQTMVEYSGSEEEMAVLQRQNASEALQSVPAKKPKLTAVLKYVALTVAACALFCTSVALPGRAQEGPGGDEDEIHEITDWQAAALAQLIEEVKNSSLSAEIREPSVVVLEELLDGLGQALPDSAIRKAVVSSVVLIDGIVSTANSYRNIAEELEKSETTEKFGSAIKAAVASYKSDGVKITKIDQVESKADGGYAAISAALAVGTDAFYDEIKELSFTALPPALENFLIELTPRLNAAGYGETDDLSKALFDFSSNIQKVVNAEGYTVTMMRAQVVSHSEAYVDSATAALSVQTYNCMMDEFIRNRLAEIFGLASSELPSEGAFPEDSGNGDNSGGDENTGSGGYGDGNIKYGSDDLIYYPDEREYVEYGKVLAEYEAKVKELINNGAVSEELAQYISQYFEILYSGNGNADSQS